MEEFARRVRKEFVELSYPLFNTSGQQLGEWDDLPPSVRSIIEHTTARSAIRQQIVVLKTCEHGIMIGPRLTSDPEKPFIELDWHLGVAYCHKCEHLEELAMPMASASGQNCLDLSKVLDGFTAFAKAHVCPGNA